MNFIFDDIKVIADGEKEKIAAELFSEEIEIRTNKKPPVFDKKTGECFVELKIIDESESEDFSIQHDEKKITVTAHRLRSLIYGYSVFLRKCGTVDGKLVLTKDIGGDYSPYMPIRGHQLSYTDMNNTYETWDRKQYERYIRDLMMFGTNTVEACLGDDEKHTDLMKYSFEEITKIKSQICEKLDINFSIFCAYAKRLSDEESSDYFCGCCNGIPKFNFYFPPGGDPGDLQAEEFFVRCKKIKKDLQKEFPNIELWPSAQAPHQYADWGERFIKEMAKSPKKSTDLFTVQIIRLHLMKCVARSTQNIG